MANYFRIPAYADQQRRLGRADLLEPLWKAWDAGDAVAARAALPDALIDEFVVWGEPRACRAQLDEIERETGARVVATFFPPKGTTFELGVTLRWDKFEVPATLTVTVVGSTRAPAVAVSDDYETQRGDGAVVASPLVNDSNPYESTGEPLKIVGVDVQNTGEPASVSFTADTVRITPSPTLKAGTIVVTYTIQDATEYVERQVSGTITVVVSDVPDQVQKPTVPTQGDEGTVTIRLRPDGSDVVMSFADTGIGIPAEEQERLFSRFFRSSLAVADEIQGTGLGLALVQTVVDWHDGTVEVDSVEGEGTTVTVRIPQASSAQS